MKKLRTVLFLCAVAGVLIFSSANHPAAAQGATPTTAAPTPRQAITAQTVAFVKPVGIERPFGIRSARWSPDGHHFAVADQLGIWLMNPADLTAAPLHLLTGDSAPASYAFSPDSTLLAIGYQDVTVLWDVASGTQRSRLQAHSGHVVDVAFSPDGSLLASANEDGTIRLWHVADQQSLAILEETSTRSSASHIAFNSDGTLLASIGGESLRVWDVQTHATKWIVVSPPSGSHTIDFFQSVGFNKQQLYAISSVEGFRAWNLAGAAPVLIPNPANAAQLASYTTYAAAPDGSSTATIEDVSGPGTLSIWSSLIPGGTRHILAKNLVYPYSVSYRPDGRLLVVITGGALQFWDTQTFKMTAQVPAQPDSKLYDVTFSPDGASFVSTSKDGVLELWSVATLTVTTRFDHGCSAPIRFSADASLLAAFCGIVHIWDVRKGKQINTLFQDDVYALAFSADNASIVTLASTLKVRTWDVKSKRFKTSPQGYAGLPTSDYGLSIGNSVVSADGQLIAIASGSNFKINEVTLFNLAAGTLLSTIQLSTPNPDSNDATMAFSPDKSLLAISFGGYVDLWDTQSGQMRHKLKLASTDSSEVLAFSPDGSLLATGGPGRAITLWDVQTEKQIAVLNASQANFQDPTYSYVLGLAFSTDGTLLISRMSEGSWFWTVQPDFF